MTSIHPLTATASLTLPAAPEPPAQVTDEPSSDGELREVFHQFVGETFYRTLLSSLRKTVDKPAYFHGGRGEEVFQSQLDTLLSEKMTDATADGLTDAMYQLFQLNRR